MADLIYFFHVMEVSIECQGRLDSCDILLWNIFSVFLHKDNFPVSLALPCQWHTEMQSPFDLSDTHGCHRDLQYNKNNEISK